MHSEIDAIQRNHIIRELRFGVFDAIYWNCLLRDSEITLWLFQMIDFKQNSNIQTPDLLYRMKCQSYFHTAKITA